MAVSPDNTDIEAENKRELNRVFLETERDSHAKLDQVMMGLGDAVNLLAGFRGKSGIEVAMEIIHLDEEKQKEALEDALFVILVDQLQQNITALKQQIADNNLRISELEAHAEVISGLIERLEDGERFALNADGSLKDAEAESIIAAYEDKYGVTVDRNDPEQLREVLGEIETRIADLRKDTQALKRELDRAEDIVEVVTDPSSSREEKQAALDEYTSSHAGQRSVDVAIKDTSRETALVIIEMRTDYKDEKERAFGASSLSDDLWADAETTEAGTSNNGADGIKPIFRVATSSDAPIPETKVEADQVRVEPDNGITPKI